jgi:4-hydroxy-tetrahydrodipicolinate synthase
MAPYRKPEARDWALAHMTGVANTTIPSYSADLKRLNEAGIRHDIRRAIALGFSGTLLCSEVNLTTDEYRQFVEWSANEARGRLHLILHAAFNTLAENIEMARMAEAAGADYALLSYPANFYPASMEEVYAYSPAFCDATSLGVMLFPVPLWNFGRLHPADIDLDTLERLVADCPNVIAIKAEGGRTTGGIVDVHRRFDGRVVISCPLEKDIIPLMRYMRFQYSGTSSFEYYGDTVPRMFAHARAGRFDEAMAIYWQIAPARAANTATNAYTTHTLFLNRMLWKFKGWLNGMNGGPIRQPVMRVSERDMNLLRRAVIESRIANPTEPNAAYFIGRNPA